MSGGREVGDGSLCKAELSEVWLVEKIWIISSRSFLGYSILVKILWFLISDCGNSMPISSFLPIT